jgi:hypothetical protein
MVEELVIEDLKNYSDITYNDYGETYIEVSYKGNFLDDVEVFTDRGNGNREYIVVNSEILYLENLKGRLI